MEIVKETVKKRKKPLPVITVKPEWCKSCEICVQFCPTKVFEMQGYYPVVVDLEKCSTCMMCEYRCPDFAITVVKGEEGSDEEAK